MRPRTRETEVAIAMSRASTLVRSGRGLRGLTTRRTPRTRAYDARERRDASTLLRMRAVDGGHEAHRAVRPGRTARADGTGAPAPDRLLASTAVASSPQISVIIPCLNEEDAVGKVVDQALEGIRRSGRAGEVVVVDNGSTDASADGRLGARRDRRLRAASRIRQRVSRGARCCARRRTSSWATPTTRIR